MRFLRQVAAIVEKDLAAELRTKESLSAMIVFSVLVLLVFNFAFELQGVDITVLGPGVLWVAFIFSGFLGLGRSFAAEKDKGSLEGVMLSPVDRGAVFLGKAISNFLFISVMEIITLIGFAFLNNAPLPWLPLIPYIVLGTIGFAAMGTLLGAVAASTKMREVMLPILFIPVSFPLIMAAVNLTKGALQAHDFSEDAIWFNILVAYDAIFLVIAFWVFEYVVEE
ncbi:MAG: heme exporter protein CcmB [Chloroflexota bacterium]|nr:heme exporter protein CcmB [Chloroflexota bacterium]